MPDNSATRSTESLIRSRLRDLVDPSGLSVSLLVIVDHRSESPTVYDVPISVALADQLIEVVAETAIAAVDAELLPATPGYSPGPGQWIHAPIPGGPLSQLEPVVMTASHQQYGHATEFGRQNLLAWRVTSKDGRQLGRVYQGFSPEKALVRSKRLLAFWDGDRFAALDAEPLVIDRNLRLFAFDEVVVMKSNSAFESLFGALPDLRVQAAATYAATLGKLPIIDGDELRAACQSDINMMRKLQSIAHKMEQPGYPEALDMDKVLEFLVLNPHIQVPVDKSGDAPALVFQSDAQHRWALLKLLDDDFLRSELTHINYEANSKTRLSA